MNKEQIQERVSQNGQPLDLDKFIWDEKTKTFSSNENDLVLDFKGINNVNFITGPFCAFNTGWNCTFKTGWNCTFDTDSNCTFNTGSRCTFNTGSSCTFKTDKECVIVRRDVFEIIQPEENVKIKLNNLNIKGFKIIKNTKTITIDGKDIEISNESYENLKKQLK